MAIRESLGHPAPPAPAERHRRLLGLLAEAGIGGGAVYDALVGATASHAGAVLLTFDRRALSIYRLVGAETELLP